MIHSVAASHAIGKSATDTIFGANAAAVKAAAQYGNEAVANATLGAFLTEDEKLGCLPTVEKVFRTLPANDIVGYAPIAGLPEFLEAVIALTFLDHRPDAYIDAIATPGGSGVLHHAIWNYTELGDTVLTSDWYWDPYETMCTDALRKIDTYALFDEEQHFNSKNFSEKVKALLAKQNNLLIIINAPAHNPTGYSLTDSEWANVLTVLKEEAKDETKKIILLVDAAYLDYAGEKNASRSFLKQFGGLPENILTIVAFSMSKGFTMYGQRTGAMIGISSSKDVITEFGDINQYTNRATWSNISRACMKTLGIIYNDKDLLAQVEKEREEYVRAIRARADIFMQEAKEVNLKILPYTAGFFLSVPVQHPVEVCEELKKENVFAVPLDKGIRIAVCAVPCRKMKGMAAKFVRAIAAVEG
ncbi:MAG: pyridoxal phosphate-dependent aminotransferase [Negativicutes bacterium]